MKNTIILYFAILALAYSCTAPSKTATVTVDVSHPDFKEVVISNELSGTHESIPLSSPKTITLDVAPKGEVFTLEAGFTRNKFFVIPGSEIHIQQDMGGRIEFQGDLANEQILLGDVDKQLSIASMKYGPGVTAGLGPEAFVSKLEEKYARLQNLLSQAAEKQVNEEVIEIIKGRMNVSKYLDFRFYPEYHKMVTGNEIELPANFMDQAPTFDVNQRKLYYFDDVIYGALSGLSVKLDASQYTSQDALYRERLHLIEEGVTDAKVKELLKYKLFDEKINMGGGAGGLKEEIMTYLEEVTDDHKKQKLEQAIALWEHLEKGKIAPDFVAFTPDGQPFRLSDMKGKHVYIDFWATWCAPCLAEIPYLKQMEQKYHDQNLAFMSVSIDAPRDTEKWKTMVEDRELSGIQIMTDAAGAGDLSKKYNITGIPRFVMIDKGGKIVDAQAPRPSNQAAFDQMISTLLD